MQRDQKQYDVVPEGSASGVTSTINGPGETPAPLTDTNADTTTNFTLANNPNPLASDTAGTAMAGSVPQPAPMTSTTFPRPLRPRVSTPSPPQVLRPEPATDTTMTATDDASVPTTTADTQPSPKTTTTPPDVKKKPDEEPPTPPPPTDTMGTRG